MMLLYVVVVCNRVQ